MQPRHKVRVKTCKRSISVLVTKSKGKNRNSLTVTLEAPQGWSAHHCTGRGCSCFSFCFVFCVHLKHFFSSFVVSYIHRNIGIFAKIKKNKNISTVGKHKAGAGKLDRSLKFHQEHWEREAKCSMFWKTVKIILHQNKAIIRISK